MNILFITNDIPNDGKANCNIAYRIKHELEKQGYNILLYGKYTENKEEKVVPLPKKAKMLCKYYNCNKVMYKVIFRLFFLFLFGFKRDLSSKIVYNEMSKNIRKITKRYNIDLIVIFSAPHELNKIVNMNVNLPIILYMLDPYFSHFSHYKIRDQLEIEEFNYAKKAIKLFVTPLIYSDYSKSNLLSQLLYKCEIVEFPNLNKTIYYNNTNKDKIVISFFGSLYYDIRNPMETIKLFSKIKNLNLEINFYGQRFGFNNNFFSEISINYPYIHFYDSISFDEMYDKINSSNFLLNIGNIINNQMPSKIIDYINTGKPIINIYKKPDDPTLKYTQKYDYVIDIDENNYNIEDIKEFIIDNKYNMVSKSKLFESYNDCSSEYIARKLSNVLENID
mgnify:CR=1 FL=1